MIKIVVVEPNKNPYVKESPGELEDLQEIVGGFIKPINFWQIGKGLKAFCNEEGLRLKLQPNRAITDRNGEIIEVIVGNIVVCRIADNGEDASMTDDDIEKMMNLFHL